MDGNGDTSAEDQPTERIRSPQLCKVQLLDGSDFEVTISKYAAPQTLVDKVCDHINLAERDYFSCSYMYRSVRHWLNPDKDISKAGKRANWTFSFELKFYPLDPTSLREDGTRYLAFLQLRLDIINGKLPCSFLTQALLGSYAAQSDVGDYNTAEHGAGIEYLRDIRFADKNTEELLEKIGELHVTHRGQLPDEAEMNYLDTAKSVALYGVHMHQAFDETNEEVNVGVSAIGLIIYKGQIREHRYPWAKILKISYKKNKFVVKIRPERNETEDPKVYKLANYEMAKRLWRMAVEHHGFFRLKQPEDLKRAQFPHFGSKFRYSGRTQFQATDGASERPKRTAFKINRKASTRFQGARALAVETDVPNFSTDRGEQMIVDAGRTNTLDLKNKMNRSGSIPLVSTGDDNRNLSVIDPGGNYEGKVTINTSAVSYAKQPYQQSGTPMFDQYGNPIFNGDDQYSTDGSTLNSRPRYDNTGSIGRDSYGRATDSRQGAADGDESWRYQEDQRLLRSGGGVAAGAGMWGTGFTSSTKTSTRTYTDSDGTVITEHITEKDGVIEKRIEKRSRNTLQPEDDDIDYDKALLEAIQSVTDMNPDMSVQKIEIHTKTESTA
jgi:hypothetical protein